MADFGWLRFDPPSTDDDGYGIILRLWWGFEWEGIVAGDVTVPVVSNFSPVSGSTIGRTQAISFDVTDELELANVFVSAYFPDSGSWEVVHDGAQFAPFYASGSTRSAIAGGFHFSLVRSGGWPANVTVRVRPVDGGGNLA